MGEKTNRVRTTVYLDAALKESAVDTLGDLGYSVSGALDKLLRYVVQEGRMPEEFGRIKVRR